MADPINLNRFRKAKRRAAAQKQTVENRVAFGRTKAERETERLNAEKAARDLAARKLDRDDND